MIQPVYEDLFLSQNKLKFSDSAKVDCRTDILISEVQKVLSVTALNLAEDSEISSGKVKVGGRVIFFITYLSQEGEIKKAECGSEYVKTFTDNAIKEGMRASVSVSVEKTDYGKNGENLTANAVILIKVSLRSEEKIALFNGGENLIADKGEINYDKYCGQYKGAYPIDEEFTLSFEVEEMLSQTVKCSVFAVQCGVGSVIVDGEAYFCATLLPKGEKKDIIREDRVIPFRMEVDADEAMPSMKATAKLFVKSFKTDIEVSPEENKSAVSLSISLGYECEVFMETSADMAIDAFCTAEETEIIKTNGCLECVGEVRHVKKSVSGRAQTEELPIGARLTAVCGEKIELISAINDNGKVKVEGVLSLTALYKDGDGSVYAFPAQTPFESYLEVGSVEGDVEVVATIERASAKTVSITQTEISAEVSFTVYTECKREFNYVKEIKSVGAKKAENSAISVYISFEGESLWSLAKRLGVCPDDLLATNPELQFPLSGEERIVIYRKR